MNKKILLVYITLMGMGLFAAGLGQQSLSGDVVNPESPDISRIAIVSFERNLNHEAGSITKTQRNSIDDDVLYQEFSSVLWTNSTDLD